MTKPWDQAMRTLVRTSPQAFIDLILPETRFIRKEAEKLKTWQLEVDALLHVVTNEQEMLLHLEFQTHNDADMPERLLRYNVLARSEHKLPVLSCVIYLLKDGIIQTSPLNWSVPTGQPILQFEFVSIEIGKLSPDEVLAMGQPGLLPFLPLTKGGAQREVIQRMFEALEAVNNEELELVGFTLASLVLNRSDSLDREWLQRKFRAMHDMIRETPIYQEILQEGIEQGREQGQVKALNETIVEIIQARFPVLLVLARQQISAISQAERLKQTIVQLSVAQDEQEAEQVLLDLSTQSH